MINNHDHMGQCIDFSGLQRKNIAPTDIDGYIEYHNLARVYLEYKHGNSRMPRGQQLALERAVDDARIAGKEAVLFLCSHNAPVGTDIDAANAVVTSVYWNGNWRPGRGESVKSWVDRFLNWVDSMT